MSIRILIADDHAIVREGLSLILESAGMLVVGEARNGREAVSLADAIRPDLVVMDIAMPELNGIDATRVIREQLPDIRVVMLSMHNTSEHVFRALHAGARGYLLKESAGSGLVDAVRTVIRGERYLGEGVEAPSLTAGGRSPLDSLSRRERQVLQLVVEGRTSAEVAQLLSLSPKSIETYRSRLMVKLGVGNLPTLVRFALQHGITPSH